MPLHWTQFCSSWDTLNLTCLLSLDCLSCFQVHCYIPQFPDIKMWPSKPSGAGRPESESVFQHASIQSQHGLHHVYRGVAFRSPALTSNPLRSLQALFSPVETSDNKPQVWGELNQNLTNEKQDRGRKLFTIPPQISKCCETQWFHMAFPVRSFLT